MYKGQLEGFPTEVVEKMLYYQVEQGNRQDIIVFEDHTVADKSEYGFDWDATPEKGDFWHSVIGEKNFDLFFSRYPKQQITNTINVKQIISDNGIETVYSILHGRNLELFDADFNDFNSDGSYWEGGECLIFPYKDERTWDRFKPKEPNYKPCESVEQFADLFLGAKMKHKTENIHAIIAHVSENTISFWFENYTLLDGTPLGIKCE